MLIINFNKIFDDEDKDCKLYDIVNIRRGASPRPIKDYISDSGINWLKISDVTGTEMPFIYKIKEKIIEKGKSKSVFIEKGTLVVSNSATPGIPKFIMVDTCVHDGWLILNGYDDNLRYYLYFLIVKIRRELINLAYGSVFNNLKTDTLKNYEISKPNENQLDQFNKIAKPIMGKIDLNINEIMKLSKLRDTLLPKLMSGEIDVSEINCDLE
ncbi:restriction endonuclease subunit S [Methanobrevibacter sp.]